MNRLFLLSVFGGVATLSACKQQGDSTTAAASRSRESIEVAACQLSSNQVKSISSSGEYKSLEKVDLNTLPASEKAALQGVKTMKECSSAELTSLSESFPSVATALLKSAGTDSPATALALDGETIGGIGGVVRTDYINMPRTGARYLAGYNSDGMMVLLMRLMQHRPR